MLSSLFILPNATFIVELVAFIVLVAVVAKYIIPPINKALEQRQQSIQDSLDSAANAEAEANKLLEKRKAELDEARQRARQIIEQANKLAEDIKKDAQQAAEAQYKEALARAQSDIELARENMLRELEETFGSLVVLAAQKIIDKELDQNKHREIIEQTIKDQSLWGTTKV
jgi:F-type H+-transporting ATPase subunit b